MPRTDQAKAVRRMKRAAALRKLPLRDFARGCAGTDDKDHAQTARAWMLRKGARG